VGLTLVQEGDAVVGEGGLELHGVRSSMGAAASSGFVSSAAGGSLWWWVRRAAVSPTIWGFGAPGGSFVRKLQ
jgi:hypothetical protein